MNTYMDRYEEALNVQTVVISRIACLVLYSTTGSALNFRLFQYFI